MEYRSVGKTGLSGSVIGLGTEYLDNKPYEVVEETIEAALEHGINIMDVFMPGEEVRRNIGKAISGNRDKFLIQGHVCSVDLNKQYDISRDLDTCKRYFDNLLRDLNTDYIDFGMLFFIDSIRNYEEIFDNGIVDYIRQLKKDGVVKAIGASSHNPVMARKLVENDVVEMLMFSINPAFDLAPAGHNVLTSLDEDFSAQSVTAMDPDRAELYKLCEHKGVGITVMKTLGAGKLLSAEHSPFGKPLSVGQCVHYALTRPAVSSVLLGCQSQEQIESAVKYLTLTDEERDYSSAIRGFEGSFKGSCVYCNHCLPCPSNINIASVNKYLDIAMLDTNNVPPSIRQHYDTLLTHGGDCISCGSCEERCPFSVPIIENMSKAEEIFGK